MAQITEEQKAVVSKFMSAFWNELVKPYYNPEETDEYWESLIAKADDLEKRFGEDETPVRRMIFGFIGGVEQAYRSKADVDSVHDYIQTNPLFDALNDMSHSWKKLQQAYQDANRVGITDRSLLVAKMIESRKNS